MLVKIGSYIRDEHMITDDIMELIVTVARVALAILFIVFVFIKSFSDNKKEKAMLTEIFQKYGVKTNAKILRCTEHETWGRTIPAKYIYSIEFQYNGTKIGTVTTCYNLPTNNPRSKEYIEETPIMYIPAYVDYNNNLIGRNELLCSIGHKFNCFGLWSYFVMFEEDINIFTNLSKL